MERLRPHPTDGTLERYLSGRVSERQAQQLEKHCIACTRCADRLQLLEWFGESYSVEPRPFKVVVRVKLKVPDPKKAFVLIREFASRSTSSVPTWRLAAAAAVIVLTISSSRLRAPGIHEREQLLRSPVTDEVVTTPSVTPAVAVERAVIVDEDEDDVPTVTRRRIQPPARKTFLVTRVFEPPTLEREDLPELAEIPDTHLPALQADVNSPAIPFEAPRLQPPKPSKIKSFFRALAWPFTAPARS